MFHRELHASASVVTADPGFVAGYRCRSAQLRREEPQRRSKHSEGPPVRGLCLVTAHERLVKQAQMCLQQGGVRRQRRQWPKGIKSFLEADEFGWAHLLQSSATALPVQLEMSLRQESIKVYWAIVKQPNGLDGFSHGGEWRWVGVHVFAHMYVCVLCMHVCPCMYVIALIS